MYSACISVLKETARFHVIMYYISPLPGNPDNIIRWRSKGHHTQGAETFEEALEHLTQLKESGQITSTIDDKVLPLEDPVSIIMTPTVEFDPPGMVSIEEAKKLIESLKEG